MSKLRPARSDNGMIHNRQITENNRMIGSSKKEGPRQTDEVELACKRIGHTNAPCKLGCKQRNPLK